MRMNNPIKPWSIYRQILWLVGVVGLILLWLGQRLGFFLCVELHLLRHPPNSYQDREVSREKEILSPMVAAPLTLHMDDRFCGRAQVWHTLRGADFYCAVPVVVPPFPLNDRRLPSSNPSGWWQRAIVPCRACGS